MKKLVKISAVLLAVGLILCGTGIFIARRDDVNPAMLYGIVEENLKLSESLVVLEQPKQPDFTGIERKVYKVAGSGLNEFNTLEIYAENADVSFVQSTEETMRAVLETGTLTTAVSGGRFIVCAICESGDHGELIVQLPEIYKGGCVVNAVGSRLDLGSVESAMDMSFCLFESKLGAGVLSADNITLQMSGSFAQIERLDASEGLKMQAAASELRAGGISASYTDLTADNSTAVLSGISGAFSGRTQMTSSEISFSALTGNVTLDQTAGQAVVRLPKGANVTLRHSEEYGLFTDRTNHAQNSSANDAAHYTMETNIKFGIVTVENLR